MHHLFSMPLSRRRWLSLYPALFFSAVPARADNPIRIGQSAEIQGLASENRAGALLYFEQINQRGGIHGRPLELISYDDQRLPEKARANTLKLIREDRVTALFGYRSTATVEAVIPLLEQYQIPLIAPFSGAQSLHQKGKGYIFHLRASYHDEAARMGDMLQRMQMQRVMTVTQDDSFGQDGHAGFQLQLNRLQIQPLQQLKYARQDTQLNQIIAAIISQQPQAVMMACTPSACLRIMKQVLASGQRPQFLMLSNVSSQQFYSELGDPGRGIGVTQVMPYPQDIGVPLVREFHKAIRQFKTGMPASYASLEGYAAAKLLCEGLKRCGTEFTASQLMSALESMPATDLGGLQISYSKKNHAGSSFAELTILGKNGTVVR